MTESLVPLKYCLYARKSSESDERQAMSIDSQINEMLKIAKNEDLNIAEVRHESKSAKAVGCRIEFNRLLQDINEGKFNAILTWAPDRLSRNAGDLGALVDLMDSNKLVSIRTYGQSFSNTPNEKFLLMILCSQAKLENDNRGTNVRRGLRAKCQRGKRPGPPPLGYMIFRDPHNPNLENKIIVDPERAPFVKKMFNYVTVNGFSGRQVNDFLTSEGFRTRTGKKVSLSMTYRMFKEAFYYGDFEYPVGSGNWYKGVHEPLVTKDQWEKAKEIIKTYEKTKWGSKSFFFGKLFKCGVCNSGVCGEERYNRFKKRYVYYKCTKYGGTKSCNEKYIREEKLIESIATMVNEYKEKDLQVHKKITKEVQRFNDMQRLTLGENAKEISHQTYIEYVLKHGTLQEKRNFLDCLDGQLFLKNGEVWLEKSKKIGMELAHQ